MSRANSPSNFEGSTHHAEQHAAADGGLFGPGHREFAAEVSWDLPNLAPWATSLIDVAYRVRGAAAWPAHRSRRAAGSSICMRLLSPTAPSACSHGTCRTPPSTSPTLRRMAAPYAVEAELRGKPPDIHRAIRADTRTLRGFNPGDLRRQGRGSRPHRGCGRVKLAKAACGLLGIDASRPTAGTA
jgi:hypothetical protein